MRGWGVLLSRWREGAREVREGNAGRQRGNGSQTELAGAVSSDLMERSRGRQCEGGILFSWHHLTDRSRHSLCWQKEKVSGMTRREEGCGSVMCRG